MYVKSDVYFGSGDSVTKMREATAASITAARLSILPWGTHELKLRIPGFVRPFQETVEFIYGRRIRTISFNCKEGDRQGTIAETCKIERSES